MIKFSLIIPVYNKESVIEATLNTIIENHDIPDNQFECVLINESSTDNSGQICKEYASKYSYIKCYDILNDGVRKPSNARNFGKDIVSGEYIMFLDADDYLCKDFMSKVCDFLDNNLKYDFYVCNRYYNKEYFMHLEKDFDKYGPSLSSCIFRKYVTDSLFFENIINEDIVYTETLILLGYKYYYSVENPPSYVYNTDNSEMIQADELSIKKYNNWICGPAEILQYINTYNYCISDNCLIHKYEKEVDNINIQLNQYSFKNNRDEYFINIDSILHTLNKISEFKNNIKALSLIIKEIQYTNLDIVLLLARNLFFNNEIKIIIDESCCTNLYKIKNIIIKNHINCCVLIHSVNNIEEIKLKFSQFIPKQNLSYTFNIV